MTKNGKNGQKAGQDKCLCPVENAGKDFSRLGTNKWGQDIHTWLITEKALDERYALYMAYNVNRLMARTNVLHPTPADVPRMQAWVVKSDFSKSHKRHLLRSLELYLEFRDIRNEAGDFFKFRKPNATRKLPTYLTQDEMRRLVRAARDYRELAFLALYCTTGVRLREGVGLNIGDLNFEKKIVTVKHAKFDKEREIDLSDETISILKKYIEAYHGPNPGPRTPLFKSQRGNRWSPHAASDAITKCGERAGLDTRVTPHVLRHSFATAMVGNECDIFHLSKMLGHSRISTTEIYLHVNNEKRREAFERGVPTLL